MNYAVHCAKCKAILFASALERGHCLNCLHPIPNDIHKYMGIPRTKTKKRHLEVVR